MPEPEGQNEEQAGSESQAAQGDLGKQAHKLLQENQRRSFRVALQVWCFLDCCCGHPTVPARCVHADVLLCARCRVR